jgi:hypothetical protein
MITLQQAQAIITEATIDGTAYVECAPHVQSKTGYGVVISTYSGVRVQSQAAILADQNGWDDGDYAKEMDFTVAPFWHVTDEGVFTAVHSAQDLVDADSSVAGNTVVELAVKHNATSCIETTILAAILADIKATDAALFQCGSNEAILKILKTHVSDVDTSMLDSEEFLEQKFGRDGLDAIRDAENDKKDNTRVITLTHKQIAEKVTSFETIALVSQTALNSMLANERLTSQDAKLMNNHKLLAEKAKESGEDIAIIKSYIKREMLQAYKEMYPTLTMHDINITDRIHIATETAHYFFDFEILDSETGYKIKITEQI